MQPVAYIVVLDEGIHAQGGVLCLVSPTFKEDEASALNIFLERISKGNHARNPSTKPRTYS
jgi:hypothetical protein